jgi:hypothetical protein
LGESGRALARSFRGSASRRARPQSREISPQPKKFLGIPVQKGLALPAQKSKLDTDLPSLHTFGWRRKVEPAPLASKRSPVAPRHTDLTGLPPTEKEIRDFLSDTEKTPSAVVTCSLASPRYGERWGRHWLIVARYADSTGNDEDHHAWAIAIT